MADDRIYKIAMGAVRGMTATTATEWIARLGSEKAFFDASESTLTSLTGRRMSAFNRDYRDRLLKMAEKEMAFIERYNVSTRYFTDDDYPARLSQCDDSPLMIYSLGECDLDAAHIVSIVGTRRSTPYGASFVTTLIEDLASRLDGLVVVSGLAYGTDVSAHRASLQSGVPTVGVLAHGLNMIYPASHRDVADRMLHNGGMLLTEYTTTEHVTKASFLARNRIIAGLSDCTIVVESDIKGGSLVTAEAAMEYNREVMALPGRVTDRFSRGCNQLISTNAASVITCADDLLSLMGWKSLKKEGQQTTLAIEISDEERAICNLLQQNGDTALNNIASALSAPVHSIMSLLVDMEFKGLVMSMPGSLYRLV